MGEEEGTLIDDDDFEMVRSGDDYDYHADDREDPDAEYTLHRDHRSRGPTPADFEALDHEGDIDEWHYTDADQEAIRAIKERVAPVKERREERERIDKEDVFTLTHSLDFAE